MREVDNPEPEIPGGIDVTYKQGNPVSAELNVRHLVDDWQQTQYRFTISDGGAELTAITHGSAVYNPREDATAREHAYNAIEGLPGVEKVYRLND